MPETETSSFQSDTIVLRPRLHACPWYPRSNCSTERYEIQQGDWLSQPGNEFYTLVSPKGCGKETVVCICCLLKAPVSQCDLVEGTVRSLSFTVGVACRCHNSRVPVFG